MRIVVDDLSGEAIQRLLASHYSDLSMLSPPESMHALGIDSLRKPGITVFSAWDGDELMGCGALKELDAESGELKSMRTVAGHLRKGVASQMVTHIVGEARRRGYRRVNLETGAGESFAAARKLYFKSGFELCGPFGDYWADPNSVFFVMEL